MARFPPNIWTYHRKWIYNTISSRKPLAEMFGFDYISDQVKQCAGATIRMLKPQKYTVLPKEMLSVLLKPNGLDGAYVGSPCLGLTRKHVYRHPLLINKRNMWRMLSNVFNRPDHQRIKEVGIDRGCAEWCLRCGAQVKWVGSSKWHTDYNTLPATNFSSYKIEEINADDAAVMDIGFEHLEGLKHLKKIRFHHCAYLEDSAIFQLKRVKDSLEYLEISNCGDITDAGLTSVGELTNLKKLELSFLPGVRNKETALKNLQAALPECEIDYRDVLAKEQT